MKKLIAYPLTCIYYLFFGFFLVLFHPIQWVCFRVFGYQAHKVSVDYLNFFLSRCLHLLGVRLSLFGRENIPENVPVILVANHRSMNDIPPIIWFMRKCHPKFISKKELGKGIPSVSYNLRHGGSILINRKDPIQAVNAIKTMAHYIEQNNRGVVIFPEGTRSRTGVPKPFQTRGLKTLFQQAPNALVLPISINNSWKTLRYGKFPMGLGAHIKYTIHQPLKVSDFEINTLLKLVESTIVNAVENE
ncbi:lysophospholipid acyltransferase family protein [Lacinutrix neustonica]|uniref:Lysophospholipid acyltransferase family protein n=1 Tax=Lacinutrix neustonica TaxID=2980107 RepID=A0A9E8SFY2_9FLAO|nr:lysophospholipid acyltransferase family protein [Lacinutrix neustonica]WAC01175.1 lysophospholipid acyltransferase family protein [Lacinutrix neustonica]